ncbi:MAG: hypothetical protein VKP57_04735 [Candidatus Sericytochromatia bacterium]|nr:hypothetical protein [Candidatus Sericytochromatia bacterium]
MGTTEAVAVVVIEVGRHELRAIWREGVRQTRAVSWAGDGHPALLLARALATLLASVPGKQPLLVLACQDRFGGHWETLIGLRRVGEGLGVPLRVACVDGRGWWLADALAAGGSPARFALPRAPGLVALARECSDNKAVAVVDLGASSAEWVRIGKARAGAGPALARLRDGSLTWIGLLDTPVDAVLRRFRGWPVVPRHARIRAASRWLALPPLPVAGVSERRELADELAAALALDPDGMLRAFPELPDPIGSLARAVVRGAIGRLVRAWRPLGCPGDEVWICGLGGEGLARPALRALGRPCAGNLEAVLGLLPGYGVAAGWLNLEETRHRGASAGPRA